MEQQDTVTRSQETLHTRIDKVREKREGTPRDLKSKSDVKSESVELGFHGSVAGCT